MTMHEFAGQPRCEAAKVVVLNTVSAMNRTNLAEVARCETSSQPSAYRSRRQKRRTRMGERKIGPQAPVGKFLPRTQDLAFVLAGAYADDPQRLVPKIQGFRPVAAGRTQFLKRSAPLTITGTSRPPYRHLPRTRLGASLAAGRMAKASYTDSCSSLFVPIRLFVL